MLPKHTKKLILLLDPESPIWPKKNLTALSKKEISFILGVSDTTVANWKNGEKGLDHDRKVGPAIDKLEKYIKEQDDEKFDHISAKEIYDAIFKSDESVYEFGSRIGYNNTESQKIIDQEIYRKSGFLSDLYYRDNLNGRAAANEDFKKIEGYYFLYVEREDHVLRCSLRVRYLLTIGDQLAIRVKMNLPSSTGSAEEGSYHEYDGFVGVKPQNLYWFFEERARSIADFFNMITDRPDLLKRDGQILGKYLTAKRNQEATILAGRVCLRKEAVSDGGREAFMHGEPKVFENQKFDELLPTLQ